jgi:putative transcription factor
VNALRCEVCGHKIRTEPVTAIIEEITLPKQTITAQKTQAPIRVVQRKPIIAKVNITEELTEDYANEIRVAREKMCLTHEELGKKINEKASVLRNLEAGKMAPNNQLASKLEHMLKIKLLVPISEEKATALPKSASQEMTLGDLITLDNSAEEAAKTRKRS